MNRSVLLQLARDSIQEVLEAQSSIDKEPLLKEHPLLQQTVPISVNIYIDNELRGHAESLNPQYSLLQEIIINAKKAAFEDSNYLPLSTSEYLHSEIEVILQTEDGVISEKDPAILQ
ncbi:MAG: AMMECR1 domain-containing protein [Campylobacterota bacterium]|nr:AMMECR1 domain-containing protein [Campylobacterota bacterium]